MKYRLATLGCKVNEYESSFYQEQLENMGFSEAEPKEAADVIIVNTCTVTNTAAAKSRQKIRHLQKSSPDALICVVGCYAQMMGEEEREALEADLIIGSAHKADFGKLLSKVLKEKKRVDVVEESRTQQDMDYMPIGSFSHQHRAFLKVQDGCNQFCTYCQIPLARGPERSLPKEDVIKTARALSQAGHKEIVLTGIHTGRYHFRADNLESLLKALLENTPEDVCYRLSSIEITEVTDGILDLVAENPRLLPHLHIPVQSACNETLKRMGRPYTIEEFEQRVKEIRKRIPNISISTDVIAGFVQESDEEFETTLRNLEKLSFSFLHAFPYSRRKGTAADRMSGFNSGDVIKERTARLLELSEKLRLKDMARFNHVTVLVERPDAHEKNIWTGYSEHYHPVRIESGKPLSGRVEVDVTPLSDGVYFGHIDGDDQL